MEPLTWTFDTVQGGLNHKQVPRMSKRSEFRPVVEDNLLFGMRSYLGIADITCADLNTVQLIKENYSAHGAYWYDTIVVSVKVRPIHVARGQHACLVPSIFLVVIDDMHLYLGVTGRNVSASVVDEVIKGIKVIDLI